MQEKSLTYQSLTLLTEQQQHPPSVAMGDNLVRLRLELNFLL